MKGRRYDVRADDTSAAKICQAVTDNVNSCGNDVRICSDITATVVLVQSVNVRVPECLCAAVRVGTVPKNSNVLMQKVPREEGV